MQENETDNYKDLPQKQMAAGVLLFNTQGQLLILHPTYHNKFLIPGGVVELDESPQQAAEREVYEEIGLSIKMTRLLVCDYWAATHKRSEVMQFIFHGGILQDEQIQNIVLEESEIKSFDFISLNTPEDLEILKKRERLGIRIIHALEALQTHQTFYLENGQKVF